MPYPQVTQLIETPDSLTPIMINHVGRHGARYPTSDKNCEILLSALSKADSLGTITSLGVDLRRITHDVIHASQGRWGALDSLGIAEQEGIAERMYHTYPSLMDGAHVRAFSSFVPRCMMSMYAFTHKLDALKNNIEFFTSTGPQNNAILRPFQIDKEYLALRESKVLSEPAKEYERAYTPVGPIIRALGNECGYSKKDLQKLSRAEYSIISALSAMGIESQADKFFTLGEYRDLWRISNIEQYFTRTATEMSNVPAEIASKLILNIVSAADEFLEGKSDAAIVLRFGHAETMMPLLSLLQIKGCYYITNNIDSISEHWKNYNVVPMASNLQLIFFRTKEGRTYVRTELNEIPVPLIPENGDLYVPWTRAREYLLRRASL